MDEPVLRVEVVYALAGEQRLVCLELSAGSTARDAVLRSGLDVQFVGLDLATAPLGIFGKALSKPEERVLEEGERVEIYRPLLADPKEVRKQRAARAAEQRAAQSE